ncbi:MAG: hypothetical protein Q7J25_00870 [Vicinamibacterales bacterium]|nr:hypothetical protein [Vicinamibacterales bacterium]
MGQPVVHFEIIGRDAKKLQDYYSELFGWEIAADNPMNYGLVARETIMGSIEMGHFTDPEGHLVGVVSSA